MVRKRARQSQSQHRGTRNEGPIPLHAGLHLDGFTAARRAQAAQPVQPTERPSGSHVICIDLTGDSAED
jgi:hypothetical protein